MSWNDPAPLGDAMTDADYQRFVKYVKPVELSNSHDPLAPYKISRRVVSLWVDMRTYAAVPFIVYPNGAFAPGVGHDFANSFHYPQPPEGLGLAIDFYMEGKTIISQFLIASRFPWTGIGLYPFAKPYAGVHCDLRPADVRALWWKNAHGEYRDITYDDLQNNFGLG